MVTAARSGAHVELGMYPFDWVAWAWDDLWAAVHARVPWLPATLTRSGDIHARWDDDDCVVQQVCGGPFAARHLDRMRLVGAFELDIGEASPVGHYHSVLLSPHDVPLEQLVSPTTRAVANSEDSLSGWFSLLAATTGHRAGWPGPVTFTSAHHESVRALAAGDADLGSIDSWSLALISEGDPELVAGLHRVALGPRIPTPAVTARTWLSPDEHAQISVAFREVLADPTTAAARAALHITGFAANTVDDYLATLKLAPTGSR